MKSVKDIQPLTDFKRNTAFYTEQLKKNDNR
jgi:hypothetical protein